jgi:ParB family chromosome partitioning protein
MKWLKDMSDSVNNNNKLGRGLSSLLGEKTSMSILNPTTDSRIAEEVLNIDLDLIDRNVKQPRKKFDEEKLKELADSIKEYGLLEPVILRKKGDSRYEIIAGERRVLASKKLGLKTIASIVRNYTDDEKNNFILSIIENIQRADLNCIEEANAYNVLNKEYGVTMENIASTVGKSRAHINNLIRLLSLPENIQKYLLEGKMEMGHARVLVNYAYASDIADYIVSKNLSVRQVEDLIRNEKKAMKPITEHIRKLAKRDFESFENKLGNECKISYQERTGKYHLAMDFHSYDDLENFVKNRR